MNTIYLVGVISEDPKTHEWRKEATRLLKDKFIINDPTVSRFDKESLKESNEDEDRIKTFVASHQAEILLPKSYQSVETADILLINFDLYKEGHAGHLMELAWGYQLHKIIVAIKGSTYYSYHPMVRGAVHAWAGNVKEACEIIKEFFIK
jgi:hypothetical protein